TNADGDATVRFVMSDAVTSFRVTAEGFAASGAPGAGQAAIQSRLPVTLDVHLPTEVSQGDVIDLPVTVGNQTRENAGARLPPPFGAAFRVRPAPAADPLHLAAGDKGTVRYPLEVVGTRGDAAVSLAVSTGGLTDSLEKTIRVVPRGFPFVAQAAGTAGRGAAPVHTFHPGGAPPRSTPPPVPLGPSPPPPAT